MWRLLLRGAGEPTVSWTHLLSCWRCPSEYWLSFSPRFLNGPLRSNTVTKWQLLSTPLCPKTSSFSLIVAGDEWKEKDGGKRRRREKGSEERKSKDCPMNSWLYFRKFRWHTAVQSSSRPNQNLHFITEYHLSLQSVWQRLSRSNSRSSTQRILIWEGR